jgi:hypothetical protein
MTPILIAFGIGVLVGFVLCAVIPPGGPPDDPRARP